MDNEPRLPAKRSRLFLIIGGLILAIVVIIFWGSILSYFSEMRG